MPRSRAGTAALWVAFALVAMVSGWIAVLMVGNAVTPASIPVLTSGEVATRLTTASPAPTPRPDKSAPTKPKPTGKPSSKPSSKPNQQPTSSTTAKPSPTPTSSSSAKPQPTKSTSPAPKTVVRTIASRGGSVVAACSSASVTLRSWSPAVGYRVDEVNRGPANEVEVKFVSTSAEVQLKVRCVSGVPKGYSQVDEGSGDDN